MAERQVGPLLVVERDAIVGIVTERDYAQRIVFMNRVSRMTEVREIMSSHVLSVRPEQTCHECMTLMSEHCLRHLMTV